MTEDPGIPVLRAMVYSDLDEIVEIDRIIIGIERSGYWERIIARSAKDSPVSSIVAEIDNKLVGFIIGDASGWEYGAPQNIGLIETIGVHPDHQRRGIAKILFTEMVNNLKKVGVDKIYTFVSWQDWNLLRFYHNMGFQKGDMINLELKI